MQHQLRSKKFAKKNKAAHTKVFAKEGRTMTALPSKKPER